MKKFLQKFWLLLFSSFFFQTALHAQISVTASAGTTGPTVYTTLKSAFDAINAGTHQGTVNISVTANTTETATASLNASGSGSASYTSVMIQPASSVTASISGSLASAPVIKLNGSNNVTIDGSNNGTTSRNLTITNTSTSSSNVLLIGSVGTTAINAVTIKNTICINGTNTSTAILCGDAATIGGPGYFSNITIQNNAIQKAYIGLYLYAVVSALNNNTTVTGNDLNASGTNALRLVAIYAQGLNGLTVSQNNIGNFETASAEFDRCIWLATATKNTSITNNTISGMAYTGTSSYAPIGINISSGITNANVSVTGNTISGLTTSGTGTSMGIFLYSALSDVTIKNNKISNIKNTNTTGYGAAGMVLAATISPTNTNVYNNFISDVAGYGYNGFESADNGNGIVIDGGGGYNIDFNTVVLNTNQTLTGGHRSSCLLLTANASASGANNIRNNIFANLQTVGNANSRIAISNLAGSGAFSTFNNNDFYATSNNLSCTGTNASITTTIAQLQTSLGGNANSVNVLPVFISTSDLHLNQYSNNSLSNLASYLSSVTTDIDGDTRSTTTPDMGADEFIPCPLLSFTGQPSNAAICLGNDTSFTASSANATQFQWQVNTGSGFANVSNNSIYSGATTATLVVHNAPVSYSGYTYQCIIINATGCASLSSNIATLTVNTLPTATATAASSTNLCPGGSVVLNAPAGFGYQWKQGGVNVPTGGTGSIYTATASGSYTVTVTNTSTGCSSTSNAISVTLNPTLTATKNTIICSNQLPYSWNGQTITSGGTAVATYTTPSVVTGCDSTTTLNLTVNSVVTANANISVCSSAMPYTWNGQVITAGGTGVATHTGVAAGGCDSITTLNLTVVQPVTATQNITICHTQLPYVWNSQTLTAGGNAAATYTTTSVVTGCDSTTTLNLTINQGPLTIATPNPSSVCSGTATAIALSSATSGSTFAWTVVQTGASGATASNGTSIAQTLTATGSTNGQVIYTITATANSCPGAALKDTVTVKPKPVLTVTPTTQTICTGTPTSVALTATVSGTTFAWTVAQTNVSGASASNGTTIAQNLTATTTTAGTATYTITPTANGCAGSTGTATITVNPVPATPGTITGSTTPCANSTQTYSIAAVTGATSYLWTLPTGWTGTSTTNSITTTLNATSGSITVKAVNSCGSSPAATIAINVVPLVTPYITISNNAPSTLCSGVAVTYTAATVNPGSSPTYQWKVNNNNMGTNSATFTYTPNNGDTVRCVLTSNVPCASITQVGSNLIIMHVTPSMTAALNIQVEENHICSDTAVVLIATPTNGGASPSYQWKVNNINVGTNSTTYSYFPNDGDLVTCVLNTTAICTTPAAVVSNTVPMTIIEVTNPSININAGILTGLINGQTVTFTANPSQSGSSYQISWYRNGVYLNGTIGNSFTGTYGTDLFKGSRISARIKSFSPCAKPDTAWSNILIVNPSTAINQFTVPDGFRVYPNPTNDWVNIEGLTAGDQMTIYDALGHKISQQTISQTGTNRVNLSGFAQGMYQIYFVNEKGQQWTVKVSKQ